MNLLLLLCEARGGARGLGRRAAGLGQDGLVVRTVAGELLTGVEVFIVSKVQCLFCFESSTTEGRGEEMGESGNFKNKANRTFDPL